MLFVFLLEVDRALQSPMHARPVCCNLKAQLFNKLVLNLFIVPVLKNTGGRELREYSVKERKECISYSRHYTRFPRICLEAKKYCL